MTAEVKTYTLGVDAYKESIIAEGVVYGHEFNIEAAMAMLYEAQSYGESTQFLNALTAINPHFSEWVRDYAKIKKNQTETNKAVILADQPVLE